MAFSQSSQDLRLENKEGSLFLFCQAQNEVGDWQAAEINLDQFIGNGDGWSEWDGINFSQSAENIHLDGAYLTADLPKADGGYRERQGIDLNDRIGNEDGNLVYLYD
ncbi:Cyanovirin-N [Penicillium pulvis]|uniref:Cyanovirin-N n=1 Tax=Penicillium pulvis TaxID=1562058 RepID=UPI0025496346|nr:Cyanovirin-N [Penicillium pulvis]KAJ5809908.1 Cyanovirin-N [Penicillium pulvis]